MDVLGILSDVEIFQAIPRVGLAALAARRPARVSGLQSLVSTSAISAMRVQLDGLAVSRSTGYQEGRQSPEFLRPRAGRDAYESRRTPVSGPGGLRQKWRKSSLAKGIQNGTVLYTRRPVVATFSRGPPCLERGAARTAGGVLGHGGQDEERERGGRVMLSGAWGIGRPEVSQPRR